MDVHANVARLQAQVDAAPTQRDDRALNAWTIKTSTVLRLIFGEDHRLTKDFAKVRYHPMMSPVSDEALEHRFSSGVDNAIEILRAAIVELEFEQDAPTPPSPRGSSADIFIVHGHDKALRLEVVAFIKDATGRNPIVLSEAASRGRTLFEKFEQEATGASFAIVLATADDHGGIKDAEELRPRARQNVVLEWGYFAGKLGRERVTLLYEQGVELPSDIGGLVYTALDEGGAWKFELARELKAAGIPVSLDDLNGR